MAGDMGELIAALKDYDKEQRLKKPLIVTPEHDTTSDTLRDTTFEP